MLAGFLKAKKHNHNFIVCSDEFGYFEKCSICGKERAVESKTAAVRIQADLLASRNNGSEYGAVAEFNAEIDNEVLIQHIRLNNL